MNILSLKNLAAQLLHNLGVIITMLAALLFLDGIHSSARAQSQVSILDADSIYTSTFNGKRIQKILGNVYLKGKNLEMYSDSAYRFTNESKIKAFGNIQINTENEKIWSDSLTYFTDIDFSKLRGRVVIETDSTTLFGNKVDYRFSTRVAHFIDKIRLEDQRGTLKADSGYYYRKADSAQFRGHVQIADSLQYLEGDSLFSNRAKKYYELYGDVYGNDQKNNTLIQGDYLESDSTGRRLLKGNAWMQRFESDTTDSVTTNHTTAGSVKTDSVQADSVDAPLPDSTKAARPDSISSVIPDTTRSIKADSTGSTLTDTSIAAPPDTTRPIQSDTTGSVQADTANAAQPDTTHIRAKVIRSVEHRTPTDTTTTVHGYKDVRIWSPSFSAVGDTTLYSDSTSTFEIWSNAKSWHENVQLTGPYIRAKLKDGNIDSLISYPRPFSVQQDTSIDRLNQITGDTLKADFKEANLKQIYVFGESRLLRYTKNEQGKPDGGIDLSAPEIYIHFKSGNLTEMNAIGNINGSYLPESEKTTNKRLDGFSWNPDLRPERPKKQMERRFEAITDKLFFTLPKRYVRHLRKTQNNNLRISLPKEPKQIQDK